MPQPQTEVSILLAGEQIYRRLLPAGEYIIGSADDAEIRFPSDQLAPRHARLSSSARATTSCRISGSALGTFVNGERVRNVRVVPETHRIEIAGSSIALRRISEGTTAIGDSRDLRTDDFTRPRFRQRRRAGGQRPSRFPFLSASTILAASWRPAEWARFSMPSRRPANDTSP